MTSQKLKQTEIGTIPEEWEVHKITELFEVKTGTTPSTKAFSYWENGTIDWITPTDMNNLDNNIELPESSRKITSKALKETNLTLMPVDSIVMSTRAPVGYVGIAKKELTFNQGCKGLIPRDRKKINTLFYAYYLVSKKDYLNSISGGSTFKELSKESLAHLEVPFPQITEQQAISEVISIVDYRIDIVERERQVLERLKVGIMRELFEGKEWKIVKLSEIAEILDNKRIPLSEMERAKRRGVYPYCGANGVIDYIDGYLFDGQYILIAEDGGDYSKFGKSAYIMNGKFWVNNHAHVLKAIEGRTTNLFLFYILNFMDLNVYIVGSTRTKLNQERLREIQIPLSSIEEQNRITEILSTLDKKLSVQQNKKSKLDTIKKGLMNDLLSGKKRLRVD